jgi:hypothetical protein
MDCRCLTPDRIEVHILSWSLSIHRQNFQNMSDGNWLSESSTGLAALLEMAKVILDVFSITEIGAQGADPLESCV